MTEAEWLDIFGDNLADLLDETNMSQQELAEAADLAKSTISSYINKKKMPSLRAVLNISKALDIDVGELIDFGEMII